MPTHASPSLARATLGTLFAAVCAAVPTAQTSLQVLSAGTTPMEAFGHSVRSAGDVDGDGLDDVIVGSPFENTVNGLGSGAARVFRGDGSLLFTFFGNASLDKFGFSVDGAGDVNGDGHDDLIVGAPAVSSSSGAAYVYSGADGTLLFSVGGAAFGDNAGRSVSGAGDVNGDGHDDVIVGSPFAAGGNGAASIHSGRDGSLVHVFLGSGFGNGLGYSVADAGDVNDDGFDDVIVGNPFVGTIGNAVVFDGLTGYVLHTFSGTSQGYGRSVAGAGDVNNDGFDDIIVGASIGGGPNYAEVRSGQDGALLHSLPEVSAGDAFGYSVAGAGDVNGDGFDDFLVGAPNVDGGVVYVHSGQDAALLVSLKPSDDGFTGNFGFAADGAGDVNGDGFADVIVGGNASETALVYTLAPFAFLQQEGLPHRPSRVDPTSDSR